MRRRVLPVLAAVLGLLAVAVTAGSSAEGDGRAPRVRAIFHNALGVTRGDEVRVAGARVGIVEDTDVTPDRRAVVVLRIDDPAFGDFRRDAECTIRPRTVVDEPTVECLPTQPRGPGGTLPPPLREVTVEGRRQSLLPVGRTARPIDLDLVLGTRRPSERARTAVLLNELGVGLAGRGSDLRRAVRAALPGLRETDRVLALLDRQNDRLRALARDGDRALRPVAGDRARLERVVSRAASLGSEAAARPAASDAGLRRLPATLAGLRSAARELSGLAGEGAPVLRDLERTAPSALEVLAALGPAAAAGTGPLGDLGRTAERARTTVRRADGTVRRLGAAADASRPVLADARALTGSLRATDGFERLLDATHLGVLAMNAFDDDGHYLRVRPAISVCSVPATTPVTGCSARPGGAGAPRAVGPAARAAERPEAPLSRRVLAGEAPAAVLRDARGTSRYAAVVRRLDRIAALRGRGPGSGASARGGVRGTDAPITVQGDPLRAVTAPADLASRLLRFLLGAGR